MKTIIIISALILGLSCQKNKGAKSNTITAALTGKVSTLDPADSYDTISATVIYQGYEQLYEYHYLKRPYTLQPLLAEGMPRVDKNGLRYTIKIKKGIQYHESPAFKGKKRFVEAQDFVNQVKRLAFKSLRSRGWWLFDGRIKGLNKFRNDAGDSFEKFESLKVEGLYAKDKHTLVIELTNQYPQMLYALAMSFTSPMPIEAIKHFNNILNNVIIGTGPYKFKSWLQGASIKLTRNENYRQATYPGEGDRIANSKGFLKDAGKKIPFVKNLDFLIIRESPTRWLQFLNGALDYIIVPKDNYTSAVSSTGQVSEELADKGIKLQMAPALTYWWLAFNMKDELMGKNLNLRKAIAHAVDVDKYVKIFTNNVGFRANSIYPPGVPGYSPANRLPYEYNLDKAREFLAKAGYPEGKGLPVITYDIRGKSTNNKQQADFIKAELNKIGIEIRVEINTFPAFLQKAKTGKLQFWQGGWAMDYPDAENVLQLLTTQNFPPGPNASYYSNKEFDQAFDKFRTLQEGDKKEEMMEKLEIIVNKDLPWIMQYYVRTNILYYKRLKNYRHSDLIYNRFKYLKVE